MSSTSAAARTETGLERLAARVDGAGEAPRPYQPTRGFVRGWRMATPLMIGVSVLFLALRSIPPGPGLGLRVTTLVVLGCAAAASVVDTWRQATRPRFRPAQRQQMSDLLNAKELRAMWRLVWRRQAVPEPLQPWVAAWAWNQQQYPLAGPGLAVVLNLGGLSMLAFDADRPGVLALVVVALVLVVVPGWLLWSWWSRRRARELGLRPHAGTMPPEERGW